MNRRELLGEELKVFIEGVKQGYRPDKIILFGSLASGNVNSTSDLDIIVVANTKENFWSRLKNISKYCSHKVGMDVLVYTPEEFTRLLNTRTFFKKEVQEKGKIVYDKTSTA